MPTARAKVYLKTKIQPMAVAAKQTNRLIYQSLQARADMTPPDLFLGMEPETGAMVRVTKGAMVPMLPSMIMVTNRGLSTTQKQAVKFLSRRYI